MFNPLIVESFLRVLPEIETIQLQFQDELRTFGLNGESSGAIPPPPFPSIWRWPCPSRPSALSLNGFLREVSQGGLRVSLNNVSLDLFTLLISTRRYARLVCLDPAWRGLHQAFCNVIWLDYYAVPIPTAA